MAARRASITELLRKIKAGATKAYRDAIAAQITGDTAEREWDEWEQDTAALLLAAWATGAKGTIDQAHIPPPTRPETFDRNVPELAMEFKPGPAREVIRRYEATIPMTRAAWNGLIQTALQTAREMRQDEQANALAAMLERSPDLARLVRGVAEDTELRRSPEVSRAVQGAFFVTGMSQQQIEQARDLLAKAVRGQVSKSVAGKKLETLGVGDFAGQVILKTGTDLTEARLETVFRTNLNRAQTQGQLDIVREPTVQKFVPVMQFSATRDSRTRDTHRAMDGFVATVQQIDAQAISTPAGFNCRCAWIAIPTAQAIAKGWANKDGSPNLEAIRRHNGAKQSLIDSGKFPDPGFIAG